MELSSHDTTTPDHRRIRAVRFAVAVVAVGSVVVAAAGCSSPSSTTTTPPTVSQHDSRLVSWATCMRNHGIAEPDPFQRAGYVGLSVRNPPPGPATDRADAWLPALTRYARCMRTHNIAMTDPTATATATGQLNLGTVAGVQSNFGRDSPQFRAAYTACRHLLPVGIRDNGTGP